MLIPVWDYHRDKGVLFKIILEKGGLTMIGKGKKILSLLMTGVIALGLVACGNSGADSKKISSAGKAASNSATSGTASSTKMNTGIDTSEHEVINLLVMGNKPTNGRLEAMLEKLNAILTEKVNAELKMTYIEWADWQTQYNVQLLSGDSNMDLITSATDWLFAWENIQKGAFMPLSEEMLKTYAPKTWASVPKEHWEDCSYNGEIYMIPEDNYMQYTNHGMYYRGDWAKKAGVETINNFNDLGKYFQWIKDNKKDCIPWDVGGKNNVSGLLPGYFNSNTGTIAINGVTAGNFEFWFGVSKDDVYTVTSPFMEGNAIYDAAELFKKWNAAGYWREDVLNYDGDAREEFYAGLSGADQHHSMTFYSSVRPNMDKKQPGSDVKMFPFSMPSKNLTKPLITHQAATISANSQHPERALMVYDLLRNDEECYRLMNYGIKGEDYIVTEDGKLARPDGYDSSTDALESNFWLGRNDDLELQDSTWWEGTQDMINEYNSYAIDYPYASFIVDKTKIEVAQSAIANVLSEYIPQLAYGKYDNPKEAIDEMRKKLKEAGYDEVKAELQSQLDAYKAKKEGK